MATKTKSSNSVQNKWILAIAIINIILVFVISKLA